MTVSIKDVAARAGVSVGSASRALNGAPNVSPDILERVRDAARTLGYRANHAARALRSRSSKTIGCMFSDITNPLYAQLFRNLEDRLSQVGYVAFIANTGNDVMRERRTLALFEERGLDAAVIAPSHEGDDELIALANGSTMPLILLDRDMAVAADRILFDHAAGLDAAVSRLAGLGHRRMALVNARLTSRPGVHRIAGFRAAMQAQGLPVGDEALILPPSSMSSVFDEVRGLLSRPDRPTAMIVQGTSILASALNAISSLRLRIPDDISLVSIGMPDFAASYVPRLAIIRLDGAMLVETISDLLQRRLAGPAEVTHAAPRTVTLTTGFEPGPSCAAAPSQR